MPDSSIYHSNNPEQITSNPKLNYSTNSQLQTDHRSPILRLITITQFHDYTVKQLQTQNTKLQTQNTKLQTQNTKHKTPNSKHKTQNTKHKTLN